MRDGALEDAELAKCTRDEGASRAFQLAQSKRMPPAKSRAKDRLFSLESAGFRASNG
jgi:hypothetical protein